MAASEKVRGESILEIETVARELVVAALAPSKGSPTPRGRAMNLGHPAFIFTTEDGTFLATVERLTTAIVGEGDAT